MEGGGVSCIVGGATVGERQCLTLELVYVYNSTHLRAKEASDRRIEEEEEEEEGRSVLVKMG